MWTDAPLIKQKIYNVSKAVGFDNDKKKTYSNNCNNLYIE